MQAFETVDHKILLDKLYNYGIKGTAYKRITSYLGGESQRVTMNDCLSKAKTITTGGVPQGTILDPSCGALFSTNVGDYHGYFYSINCLSK